jgi:hypothetical protein
MVEVTLCSEPLNDRAPRGPDWLVDELGLYSDAGILERAS